MTQVGGEECLTVVLGQPEGEAPLLLRRVLHRVDVVSPRQVVAVEGVVNGVVWCDGEGNAAGGLGARERETAAAGGGGGVVDGVEVQVNVTV